MIKHDEDCPTQEREFPCCEDQMCPCDRDAFEKLQAELDATLMALNIEKQKNARYRKALEFYADGELVIAQKTDPEFSEIEKEMELLSDDFDVSVENGYWVKGKRAREALGHDEPDEVYDYDGL